MQELGDSCYSPSRTLNPTFDQSMVLTGGGGNCAMVAAIMYSSALF